MSRAWWKVRARGGAPSPEEIAEELRAHLELLEGEELARGLDPDAARAGAGARFGDVRVIQAEVARAWEHEAPLARRLARAGLLAVLCLFPAWMLRFVRLDVAEWPRLTYALPAMLLVTIPVAMTLGVAVAIAGRTVARKPPRLMRPEPLAATLLVASIATLAAAALYLVVPMANAEHVAAQFSDQGKPLPPFRGVQSESIPVLLTLADVGTAGASAPLADWVARLPRPAQVDLARRAELEVQKRAALCVACIPLAMAGLAAGACCAGRRLGRALACAGGLAIATVYYFASELSLGAVSKGAWPPALLAWAPNLALTLTVMLAFALRWRWERARSLANGAGSSAESALAD